MYSLDKLIFIFIIIRQKQLRRIVVIPRFSTFVLESNDMIYYKVLPIYSYMLIYIYHYKFQIYVIITVTNIIDMFCHTGIFFLWILRKLWIYILLSYRYPHIKMISMILNFNGMADFYDLNLFYTRNFNKYNY